MSKLTQIQKELHAVDQATFQQLCDALLYAKGYRRITQIGTVLGANKVARGTPDTRFVLPDGRFVFVEYTTQQTGVFGKLLGDLRKCFDEARTGIPVSRIGTIILCHNTKLETEDEASLIDECKRHGVDWLIFGPSDISLELYHHHRALARDFLGVTIDTGQILSRDAFIREYNKSAVAPPIDTAFRFRTKEVDEALAALEASPVLIITGRPGVGKTRFAVEAADIFAAAHPGTIVRAVYNRGVSVFDDVQTYFGAPGHYVILVDDANRLAGLDHVLQVLRTSGPDRRIWVVITVRDYALEKVRDAARAYGEHIVIALEPFSKEQIRELGREGFGIENHLFLDRIATIAKGNPRLAVMAARAVQSERSIEVIHDASGLYDVYFGSIRSDLGALGDERVLSVAGIIAFFRVVDRSNAEMMGIIDNVFGIAPGGFWDAVIQLHELELVDVHDQDVVRISDQVLATYLFYLAFFRSRLLSLGTVLDGLFPRFRHRLMDALRPVAETFHSNALMEEVRTHVAHAWRNYEVRSDNSALLHLIDAFAGLEPTRALLFAKEQIDRMVPEPMVDEAPVSRPISDSTVTSPSLLSILQGFQFADESDVRMALELLCDYVAKRPVDRGRVIHILQEPFGMDMYSHLRGYARERAVVEVLVEHARGGRDALVSELFLEVADAYLHTEFTRTAAEGARTIAIRTFTVPLTPELEELRKEIWKTSFALVDDQKYKGAVLQMLAEHSRGSGMTSNGDAIGKDAPLVLGLLQSRLSPSDYSHCAAVQEYLDGLDQRGVTYDVALRQRFQSETLTLAATFTGAKLDRLGINWREQEAQWLNGVRAHVADYDADAYRRLLERCAEIQRAGWKRWARYSLETAIVEALLVAAGGKQAIFVTVMREYLRDGNRLQLEPWGLVPALVASMGAQEAFELLSGEDYWGRRPWRLAFLRLLPKEEVRTAHLHALYGLYTEADGSELPHDLRYLGQYADADPGVTHQVVSILTRRAEEEPRVSSRLAQLFEGHEDAASASIFGALIGEDPELLRRAYFAYVAHNAHGDYDGKAFNAFLDKDSGFMDAYVALVIQRADEGNRHHREREYDFLWKRSDYAAVMGAMVEGMYDGLRGHGRHWGFYPQRLFLVNVWSESAEEEVRVRQDEVLGSLLRQRSGDGEFVQAMFAIVAHFSSKRRLGHIKTLVEVNHSLELFSALSLEPSHMSWSGSQVPVLEERAAFWMSARTILGGLTLLGHRKLVEERLQRVREEIEGAKRAEFMED